MDFVSGGGEFDAEFGGDDSGAAVGGIAGDADAHCAALQDAVVVFCRDDHKMADRPVYGWSPKSCRFSRGQEDAKTLYAAPLFLVRLLLDCYPGIIKTNQDTPSNTNSNLPPEYLPD